MATKITRRKRKPTESGKFRELEERLIHWVGVQSNLETRFNKLELSLEGRDQAIADAVGMNLKGVHEGYNNLEQRVQKLESSPVSVNEVRRPVDLVSILPEESLARLTDIQTKRDWFPIAAYCGGGLMVGLLLIYIVLASTGVFHVH